MLQTKSILDVESIRKDFPILQRKTIGMKKCCKQIIKTWVAESGIEPQVSSHPFISKLCVKIYKSFDWVKPGWQNQAMCLPQEQVGSHPSGFKTQGLEPRVPAPAPNNKIC